MKTTKTIIIGIVVLAVGLGFGLGARYFVEMKAGGMTESKTSKAGEKTASGALKNIGKSSLTPLSGDSCKSLADRLHRDVVKELSGLILDAEYAFNEKLNRCLYIPTLDLGENGREAIIVDVQEKESLAATFEEPVQYTLSDISSDIEPEWIVVFDAARFVLSPGEFSTFKTSIVGGAGTVSLIEEKLIGGQ